jgi:hypothetical protein
MLAIDGYAGLFRMRKQTRETEKHNLKLLDFKSNVLILR